MKIWVIGRNYPLPQNNMQGSFELEQAKMLAKHGHTVCYLACCLHPTRRIVARGIHSWIDENVTVFTLSAFFSPRVYPFYFTSFRNYFWKKLMNRVEKEIGIPDVIHVHYPAMLMISETLWKYKEFGVKLVATEHWTKVVERQLDKIELLELRKYRDVIDSFICVGSPLASTIEELVDVETVVVPNVVNSVFKPSNVEHSGYRFVAVGRLVPVKQFDFIIKAFAECFCKKENVFLQIIGGGTEKERLQRTIDYFGIADKVKLVGSLDRQKTAECVANCDALVCYSRCETFGVPIIEAWACGLTTIATSSTPVVIDYSDEKLGVIVSGESYEELKDALLYVYNHRNDYDKSYISKYAYERFSEDSVYGMLLQIYK